MFWWFLRVVGRDISLVYLELVCRNLEGFRGEFRGGVVFGSAFRKFLVLFLLVLCFMF